MGEVVTNLFPHRIGEPKARTERKRWYPEGEEVPAEKIGPDGRYLLSEEELQAIGPRPPLTPEERLNLARKAWVEDWSKMCKQGLDREIFGDRGGWRAPVVALRT